MVVESRRNSQADDSLRSVTGPNIALVVVDTARRDSFDALPGSSFAEIGRRGRRFRRAVAPAPWTLPSHASLFSGLRPSEHMITGAAVLSAEGRPRSPRPMVEALSSRWLPERLRRAGYATFAASANPWVGEAVGLTFGFEEVFESWRHAPLPKLADPLSSGGAGGASRGRRPLRAAAVYARRLAGRGDGGAEASRRAFGSFIAHSRGQPFFAFFNLMEPHAPYAPPSSTNPLSWPERVAALRAVRKWNSSRMLRYCVGGEEIDGGELRLLRALYAGEIAYADAWVAQLVDGLERSRRLDDTVVVVTSDHGENLGERHLLSHVMSMDETLLSVPLAMSGPGVPVGEESRPVGLAALASTLVALTNGRWEDPAGRPAIAEYESAAAQVSGARRIEEELGEVSEEVRATLRARWIAVYDGRFKYLASSDGRERLADLDADPAGTTDVSNEHPEALARLRTQGDGWAGDDGEPAAEILDAEIAAHLEGLGYL